MKKIFKSRIFAFILGAIIFGGIGVLASVQFQASEVGYKGTTVDRALDDLYNKINSNGNINLAQFNNEYIEQNILPKDYENVQVGNWYLSKSSIDYEFDSNSDFEISFDINYINNSSNMMGGPEIHFYFENNEVGNISVYDSWGAETKTVIFSNWNNKELNNSSTSDSNCSGRYSVVRKNNVLSFYRNTSLLNSINFDENVKFDKIEVLFKKYNGYSVVNSNIKNIYIGDVENY